MLTEPVVHDQKRWAMAAIERRLAVAKAQLLQQQQKNVKDKGTTDEDTSSKEPHQVESLLTPLNTSIKKFSSDSAQKYLQGNKSVKLDNYILLDNLQSRSSASGSKKVSQKNSKRSINCLSMKRFKKSGALHLPEDLHKFDLFKPMHGMWENYMMQLTKVTGKIQLPSTLLAADLHGAFMFVAECKIALFTGCTRHNGARDIRNIWYNHKRGQTSRVQKSSGGPLIKTEVQLKILFKKASSQKSCNLIAELQTKRMNQSQHLPKSSPKRLFFFVTPILFFSLYYILTSIKTITIFSQDTHHLAQLQVPSISRYSSLPETSEYRPQPPPSPSSSSYFPLCPKNFTNYLPCHDPSTARKYSIERHYRRERHCPDLAHEKLRCMVPKPSGYKTPFSWRDSRSFAWFKNVPFKRLVDLKKTQNWVRLEGDRFVFPGGGTSFPGGVKDYVDVILKVLPLASGSIRTVLDIGCGVASFGAFLLNYNILTMSIAPRDIHEAQVQFALERGLPAMLGVLSTYKLPYPSRSFDMVHCSRCLVNWTAYDGLYLMEVDRILRPDGYWVLSGPPVTSTIKSKKQKRDGKDLQHQMEQLNNVFRRLCWEKIAESYPVVIWRKPSNHLQCIHRLQALKFPEFCSASDPDAAWYREMELCITLLPDVNDTNKTILRNWPERLNHVPQRIKTGMIHGTTIASFKADTNMWQKRVLYYDTKLKFLRNGRYRNIIDMNAGLGGFAAALIQYPMWVMNVVPFELKPNTLGVVYDRGLIGTYMNWCEAFSTYPRSYDLIHANGVFSLYLEKCDIVDVLLEMQRILRPEGALILRDHCDVLIKVKSIINQMKWNGTIYPHDNSGFDHETILIVDNSVK